MQVLYPDRKWAVMTDDPLLSCHVRPLIRVRGAVTSERELERGECNHGLSWDDLILVSVPGLDGIVWSWTHSRTCFTVGRCA